MSRNLRIKGYVLLLVLCLFYWVIDSIWSYMSFELNLETLIYSQPGSYLDTFLLLVPPYQIVSRLMVTCLFIILGLVVVEFLIKRQAMEAQRKKAHDTLLTILNSIDATIYAADMETYEIIFMNRHMIDVFGRDYTHEKCYRAFMNLPGPCGHCKHGTLLDKEGNPTGVEVWEHYNPVAKAWYLNYDRAIKWLDGRMVHLQIATDISHFKKMQEEKEAAESRLQQAQKMESIGRLAGGIAHDFNNILAVINGYADIALMNPQDGDTVSDNLNNILSASHRAEVLVKQIMAFSRKAEIQLERLDLNQVVNDGVKLIQRTIPKMIEIELHLEPKLKTIRGDAYQLEQVLLNLAANARDAMPEGGRLIVETANTHIDDKYASKYLEARPGDYTLLMVSDTGTGMNEEELRHIFEPFYTTKEIGRGTGLGMASVYGIIKGHDGYINCYSEIDKGTAIKIYLPVESQAAEADAEPEVRQDEIPELLGNETILLVDDDENLRDVGLSIFQNVGYQVITAASGEEALELFQKLGTKIDLIVLDLGMPGMGGKRCLQEILTLKPSQKVLIASGYSANGNIKDMIQYGASGYITKPYRRNQLLGSVRQILED
jgi:signal transduction histidine kinase/CheY-like chemotaxis protein